MLYRFCHSAYCWNETFLAHLVTRLSAGCHFIGMCACSRARMPYQSRHAHARYRRLKVWTFISLRSVNRTYAYAHWWSNIHYRYGEKCSKTRINSKDSCHSSTATIMDTSVADLTAPRLSGVARFLSRCSNLKYFYSHIRLIHLRQQQRC